MLHSAYLRHDGPPVNGDEASRAAVTAGAGRDGDRRRARPGEPGVGEVLVEAGGGRPLRLGLPLLPRRPRDWSCIRASRATSSPEIVEAVGPESPAHLRVGERVAVWPLTSCGHCYPCRIGRRNVCANIRLVGIHRDGALQERLRVPLAPGLPGRRPGPGCRRPDRAGFDRGTGGRQGADRSRREGSRLRRRPDRAGCRDRGDRPGREGAAARPGREPRRAREGAGGGAPRRRRGRRRVAAAREWAGEEGPEVVFEATGVPEVAQTAVAARLARRAGRRRRTVGPRRPAPGRRPRLQGDRRARRELLQRATSSPRRCRSSRGGRTRCEGSSRTSFRSTRLPRQSTTRCVILPRS